MIAVSELWIYPVKSCGGIQLSETEVDMKGFKHDRRFMVVDDNGQMVTQRQYHNMALIAPSIVGESLLYLSAPGLGDIRVPLRPPTAGLVPVQIWDDNCDALEVNNEANEWFSGFLGFSCRLVYMPDETKRVVDTRFNFTGATTTFTDGFPVLLISQASLDELNNKLDEPVPMNRFRPNIVVSGTQPFEEDTWVSIKAGDVNFDVVKPCSRCVMTTVEQSTRKAGKEPLRTLATFRSVNNKIMFGQNLIHIDKIGKVKTGNVISLVSAKPVE